MLSSISVSVMITSYNQAKSLRLLFASLERQTHQKFEVILADDGSHDETLILSQEVRKFPIRYVTQEDLGYRKSRILNQGIQIAQSEYLIFLDADVILEKHFIEDHLSLRKRGSFVCGRRVDLGPVLSSQVSVESVNQGFFDRLNWRLIGSHLKGDTVELKRALRVKNSWIRNLLGYQRHLDILGSNFSVWKSDLIEINGFNEALESYWGEDGDLYIRLRNAGKVSINAKGLCIQYHVYHQRREPNLQTMVEYQQLLQNKEYKWALKGLN